MAAYGPPQSAIATATKYVLQISLAKRTKANQETLRSHSREWIPRGTYIRRNSFSSIHLSFLVPCMS